LPKRKAAAPGTSDRKKAKQAKVNETNTAAISPEE